MKRLITGLLLVSLLLPLGAQDREQAIGLNERGFDLYADARYSEALELFEAAWRADDTYLYAHYNYACTLSILVREEPATWYYEREAAFDHLERTLELRPSYRDKMLADPDLSELRKEFRFYDLLGYDTTDRQDAAYILTNLSWYGAPSTGIYPFTSGAEFYSDGTVRFWFYTPAWFESFDDADKYRVQGSYSVTIEGVIRIELEEPMLRKSSLKLIMTAPRVYEERTAFSGHLTENGELIFDIFEFPYISTYEKFSS